MKKSSESLMQSQRFQNLVKCEFILLVLVICGVFGLPVMAESSESDSATVVEFNVSPVSDDEQRVVAIAITPPESEKDVSDLMVPLNSTQVFLTDPDGNPLDVVICAALDFSQPLTPGKPMYLVKRNKPYYFLIDELTRGGCGGGGGSGNGGGTTNKAITPEGNWTITITGENNASVYNGTFTV